MTPRRADPRAPILVPNGVGPQVARIGLDRGDDIIWRMRRELLGESGNNPPPLALSLAKGGQDRIVQIEQNGARQVLHQVMAAGACGTPFQKSPSCPKKIRAPPASRRANRSRESNIACRS